MFVIPFKDKVLILNIHTVSTLSLKKYLIALLLCLCSGVLSAQEVLSSFRNEFTYGVNFNTNGGTIGGFIFRYGRLARPSVLHTYGLEISNVKHPKEIRQQSPVTGGTFIYGKQNYLYAVRLQYGRQFILLGKDREQGIRVGLHLAVGPSLGLLTPYYIFYGPTPEEAQSVPFDPAVHTNPFFIYDHGSPFAGLGQAKLEPGFHFKIAPEFETGISDRNILSIEAGFMLESYFREITLIPFSENRKLFPSFFANISFGFRR